MSSPGSPDRDLRAARRTVALLVVALGAAAAGFVVILIGDRGDDGAPDVSSNDDPVIDGRRSASEDGEPIGPEPGTDVGSYIDERQDALRALEGDVTAVVSLTGYSTVATVEDVLEGLTVDSYLVALPGTAPQRTADIDAAAASLVADAEAQRTELEELAPTVEDDPEFEAFYRREIERFGRVIDAATDDDVVFGIVVTGSAAELRALGARASVRLVDAVAGVDADDAVVAGLRPEERRVVGEPPFRP